MSDNLVSSSPTDFPQGFLWGAATSSHQIEGDNRLNDWWAWEKAGKTTEESGLACDSYNRYEEDLDLAAELHQNAHRFSVEWSRVEPNEGQWDDEAIRHYRDVVRAMKQRGIEPIVTLHHFTNPLWTYQKGGWENGAMAGWFVRYAEKMTIALGPDVNYWITINESNVFVFKSYLEGHWPPGKSNLPAAYRASENLMKAHKAAYKAIHFLYDKFRWPKPQVGIAHHMMVCEPLNASKFWDRMAAKARMYFNNDYFLKRIDPGKHLDFIGINYYLREIIKKAPRAGLMDLIGEPVRDAPQQKASEKNDLLWEIYPEGLCRVVLAAFHRYRLPIMITENGTCTHDEELRKRFILKHLQALKKSLNAGARVFGYMYWSLLDNFEWSIGYQPKFGLISVNPENRNRMIKSSARYYADICLKNALPG